MVKQNCIEAKKQIIIKIDIYILNVSLLGTLNDNMDKLYIMPVDIVNAHKLRNDDSSTTENK